MGASTTASILAGALVTLSGCSEVAEPTETCGHVALDRPLLVLESDLTGGSALGLLGTDGCFVEAAAVELGHDPTLSFGHDRAFVCVRDQGVIFEVTTATDASDRLMPQIGAAISASSPSEATPNPWDVDVAPDGSHWIARYDLDSLGIVSASGELIGSASLATLADSDGLPEASAVRVGADRAYVALERLDRSNLYEPVGPGFIAALDLAPPHAIARVITLSGRNPFGRLVAPESDPDGDVVFVATPGDHEQITATDGIERIDLATGEATLVLDETQLGGSALMIVIASPSEGYAIIEAPVIDVNPTKVVRFDPASGEVTRTLAEASRFVHAGLAINGDYVVVGDRSVDNPRLRFFDRATGAEAPSVPVTQYPPVGLSPAPENR